ncbi:hypothetical protein SEVIR_3G269800v4 [Setaria viridis]|uniref:BRCT domain-containing protein n=1 Tax=Setaria viridis TaxID=4556 RepID=A0A4U6VDR9_SETVI|nr:uncharacterized protein LOC117850866 isoform X1 [Setaria viridis]XP_034588638.1 uncharacterized protein LOC117850866 isoform X1 [Setaria viridis]TKW27631.1 hypothetical protein SEVIR_3G269800v2 [Setaria viridis]
MGRPRKTKAEPEPAPAFSIGNCKVEIHGGGLRCESTEQALTVSGPRGGAKVVVSVHGDQKSASNGVGEGSQFILLNPSDADSQIKSLLQEVLTIYKQELPSMDYAADTGRNSGFLEKCTTNGKYKTLILMSTQAAQHEEVVAAVSYQIVPADTQYAEIPLAVVRSSHQRAGIGHLLYKELSQRLQNVGITTIFCWADKVSEGFWLKQGFVSIGEVDTRGKIRKIPVRADIKRALCFPGGSTLMVAHLKKELPILQAWEKPQTSPLHTVVPDSISPDDTDDNMVLQTFKHRKVRKTANVARTGVHIDCGEISLSEQEPKKRIYEMSSSSLKSKRIRCSNDGGNGQDMNQSDAHDNYFCSSPGNSVPLIPKENRAPSLGVHFENKMSGEEKAVVHSNGNPTIMLMNIADEQKKARLTKVVETLGGFVTCEGHACTHIVTGKVRRTMNFCIALSSGAWIVSPNWLKESFRQGQFVGEAQYVLEDEEFRMQYKSVLRDAVMRAKERPNSLFSGYTFCLSKYIQPSFDVLSSIIKSTGGKIIKKLSELDEPSQTIFLVCEEETELALVAAKRGIKTFSSDWFMSCVMKQELDLEAPQFTVSL